MSETDICLGNHWIKITSSWSLEDLIRLAEEIEIASDEVDRMINERGSEVKDE